MSILKIEETDPVKIRNKCLLAYARFLETMSGESKSISATLLAKDVHYKSPLYDVFGRDEILNMFVARCINYDDYKFKVLHKMWGEDEQTAFLRWDMMMGAEVISGTSELMFDLSGLVVAHTDFYNPIPLLTKKKPLTRYMIKRHMRITD